MHSKKLMVTACTIVRDVDWNCVGSGSIHCIYISTLGKKTAMKFDVEKIFQETRRTAREYSQQASGRSKYISPSCLLTPQAESLTSIHAVEVFMLTD